MPSTTPRHERRNCLVTGGAGFIGSHLTEHLIALGRNVTVIDDLSTGRRSNLDDAARRADRAGVALELIEAKVGDALAQSEPGTFDEIYHLAASVGVRLVIEQPIDTIQNNVEQTAVVLRFASGCAGDDSAPVSPPVPLLLASTSEVYGKSAKTPFHEDDDVVYGPTIYSRWSYACSKAIDEYLAIAHHRRHGLPVVIARFFNTVGPRQLGDYGMVIPRFVERAVSGLPLEVHGDGRQSRCFCDVRDVVEILPRMLDESACHGKVFNVGNDVPIEIGALAQLVCRTLGSESPIKLMDYADAFGDGFDDLRVRQPDLSRLRAHIGFSPRIDLTQTIRDIAHSMQHAEGRGIEA